MSIIKKLFRKESQTISKNNTNRISSTPTISAFKEYDIQIKGENDISISPYGNIDISFLKSKLKKADIISLKETHTIATDDFVYNTPPFELLKLPDISKSDSDDELQQNIEKLKQLFRDFKVSIKEISAYQSASVTCYEIQPDTGVRIKNILSLKDDISLALSSPIVNIQTPIPNKSAVGIEVLNKHRKTVHLREILVSDEYTQASELLSIGLGKDMSNNIICSNLNVLSPLLVGGTTGSGKSIFLHSIIVSLLYKSSRKIKLILIDTSGAEFGIYNGIPQLAIPVIENCKHAVKALDWVCNEIHIRYKNFSEQKVKDIDEYNKKAENYTSFDTLPEIVIIIDEIADIVKTYPQEVENSMRKITEIGNTAGIHLIISTQRPSVKVVAGIIKANIPNRIAFTLPTRTDSQIILDSVGAEKLLGNGDMLLKTLGATELQHIQGCYVSDNEIEDIVKYIKSNNQSVDYPHYIHNDDVDFSDYILEKAIEIVVDKQIASTTLLQRNLFIGYAKATRLIDELETLNIVGPFKGSNPRDVLITKKQWENIKSEIDL